MVCTCTTSRSVFFFIYGNLRCILVVLTDDVLQGNYSDA